MRLSVWLAVLTSCLSFTSGYRCPREPREEHSLVLKNPGDNGFRIQVSGEPEQYVPESVYTLSIVGSRTHGKLQMFSRFMLGVEPLDPNGDASPQRVGSFQLFGDSLTTFDDRCVNTISEADDLPKTEVQVMWISPPKGSGCVVFKAMVLEDSSNWYADEGALSRELCELTSPEKQNDEEDDQRECCACDEAKYKMVFEGIWSNKTHPKDFPFSLWLTHFSDVIGASHERNFSFWGEGQIASDGLRMVAEWGSVRGMESELRANSKHLRTLIKAAGLWYPNVNTNTSSTFRVDRRRHLVSLVSMLGPTPDWIVGVNGLNLCRRDCSWTEEKIVDLYPWDAGTDSGISYMSPNSPTIPRERIHRITTMYPEDPLAPFYNPGGEMKPIARLYLFRDSVIPKSCDEQDLDALLGEQLVDVAENTEDTTRPECAVTEYTEWGACSVTCGKGLRMRQREYINQQKALMMGCDRQLVSKEMCVASEASCPGDELEEGGLLEEIEGICNTTPWGPWSECSVTCGVGFNMRTRRFLDRMGNKKCPHISLVEKEKCMQPECTGPPDPQDIPDPMCPATEWSDWSPCSATCGKGVKLRTRLLMVEPGLQEKCSTRIELVQQRPCQEQEECTFDMATAKLVCMMEPEVGPCRGFFERWYYEPRKGMCVPFGYGGCRGNRNNFLTAKECSDSCNERVFSGQLVQGPRGHREDENSVIPTGSSRVNCVVTEWGPWGVCSTTCGVGFKERARTILVQPANGGKPCPKRLTRRKKCHNSPCQNEYIDQ